MDLITITLKKRKKNQVIQLPTATVTQMNRKTNVTSKKTTQVSKNQNKLTWMKF